MCLVVRSYRRVSSSWHTDPCSIVPVWDGELHNLWCSWTCGSCDIRTPSKSSMSLISGSLNSLRDDFNFDLVEVLLVFLTDNISSVSDLSGVDLLRFADTHFQLLESEATGIIVIRGLVILVGVPIHLSTSWAGSISPSGPLAVAPDVSGSSRDLDVWLWFLIDTIDLQSISHTVVFFYWFRRINSNCLFTVSKGFWQVVTHWFGVKRLVWSFLYRSAANIFGSQKCVRMLMFTLDRLCQYYIGVCVWCVYKVFCLSNYLWTTVSLSTIYRCP